MPRETVYDLSQMYDVEVAWTKGQDGSGYVQLGIKTHDERSIADVLYENQNGNVIHTAASFNSLWGTLSEESIDELIAKLKKAKRQAYPNVKS